MSALPLQVSEDEVEITAMRAQGAGGQNVNKVSSAVHLRFDVAASSLPDDVKDRLLALRDSRITQEGVVVIKAQQYRSQEQNRADAMARLNALVNTVAVPPRVRRAGPPASHGDDLRQQLAAPRDVPGHGVLELLDAVEPQGRADVRRELHHDPLVVELEVVPVEDVRLDGAAVIGVEGRVGPDADRGGHRPVGRALLEVEHQRSADVHAFQGQHRRRQPLGTRHQEDPRRGAYVHAHRARIVGARSQEPHRRGAALEELE